MHIELQYSIYANSKVVKYLNFRQPVAIIDYLEVLLLKWVNVMLIDFLL